MKTCCKKSDPSDLQTILKYTWQTLSTEKLRRRDYSSFVAGYDPGLSAKAVRRYAAAKELWRLEPAVVAIALDIKARIEKRALGLPPVRLRERRDGMCGKVRVIGVESVLQQIMEHVAVGCLEELWRKKLVYHQYASIQGKGQWAGARTLQRWVKRKRFRYFVKLDVRKCFPSIRHEVAMRFLRHDIGKNRLLLWFAAELLKNHGDGLLIGSLLSQFLCNYLMSFAYRHAMDLFKARRGKRKWLLCCGLFYMDDVFLAGGDRRDVKMAVRAMIRFFRDGLGLSIKPDWHIKNIFGEPIDMMGYKIKRGGRLKVRGRIFLRARRAFARFDGSLRMARKISSYYGYLKHCGIKIFQLQSGRMLKVENVKNAAANVVSLYDRRNVLCAA